MPTTSSRRAARSSALKVMFETAAVFSGVEGLAGARGGAASLLPREHVAWGVGLICVGAGLFVFFSFGGITAYNTVTMSL